MKGHRTDLVNGFRHSVPYINIHRDKTFVITLDGNSIADKNFAHIARRLNFDYSICIKNRSSIVHPVSIFLRLA